MGQQGSAAVGRALDVTCPTCSAPSDVRCFDEQGQPIPPHVERGRMARWTKMGVS